MLNESGVVELPELSLLVVPVLAYDTDGDGIVAPADVIVVVNALNQSV